MADPFAQAASLDAGRPVTKKDAKARGLPSYFTGSPCIRGHICERKTVNGACRQCASELNKAYVSLHAERRKERRKLLKIGREDEIRAIKKSWRDANREAVRESDRLRGRRHKEKVLARALKWQKENPDKVRAREARRRALVENAGTYTPEDVADIMSSQNFECAYCKTDVRKNYHVDHIFPLSLGGKNTKDNLQICCPTCNAKKGALPPDVFAVRFKAECLNACS